MGKRMLIALCALALVSAGCGSDQRGPVTQRPDAVSTTEQPSVQASAAAAAPTRQSVLPSAPNPVPPAPRRYGRRASNLTPDDLSDIDTAVWAVNGFWQSHWSQFFSGAYTPPQVRGLYDGNVPENSPACGGQVLGPQNAFYCPDGHFVVWDVNLMNRSADIGDAFLYLVIAHEWGHAVQAHVQAARAVAYELQADCLAGAALYGAMADGQLNLEQGDVKELTSGLTNIADETAWTNERDHGDPFQRIQSFDDGRTGGVLACFQ